MHADVAACAAVVVACVVVAIVVRVVVAFVVRVVVAFGDCVAAVVADATADSYAVVGGYRVVWRPDLFLRQVVAGDVPADEPLMPGRTGTDCYAAVIHGSLPPGSWQRWQAVHDSRKHIVPG